MALLVQHHLPAQEREGSPYSSFGLGDLVGNSQTVQSLMGGTSVAIADPFSVNQVNPASYASLLHTSFELGVVSRYLRLSTVDLEQQRNRVEIQGMSLGMPFNKGRWGLAFGIAPVSRVGFRVNDRTSVPEGPVRLEYAGNGGLNRLFVGLGHDLVERRDSIGNGHRLSLGANVNHSFGNLDRTRKAYYPTSSGYYNTKAISELVLRGTGLSLGMQFQGDLVPRRAKEDDPWRYILGAYAEPQLALNARRDEFVHTFVVGVTGIENPRDTVLNMSGVQGRIFVPMAFGVGFTVYNGNWTVTAEHRRRDWSAMEVDVEGFSLPSDLGGSTTYAVGASYRPASEIGGKWSFWERSIYRAGFRMGNDYIQVRDQQLHHFGMTFGTSMPVMNSYTRSRFNIGLEVGERGTTDAGLIRERYVDIHIGLTITPDLREQWLKKRRIE